MIEIVWFLDFNTIHGQTTINLKYSQMDQNRAWFEDLDRHLTIKYIKASHKITDILHESIFYTRHENTGLCNQLSLKYGLTFSDIEQFLNSNKINNNAVAVEFIKELNLFIKFFCDKHKIIL